MTLGALIGEDALNRANTVSLTDKKTTKTNKQTTSRMCETTNLLDVTEVNGKKIRRTE